MEYLDHIIYHDSVKVDINKIKSIKEWKIPTTMKHIQGFMGLTGYYHNFVKHFERISTPLTSLLEKDAFLGLQKQPRPLNILKRQCAEHRS